MVSKSSWITNHLIKTENIFEDKVFLQKKLYPRIEIVKAARARWKVENENNIRG